MAQEGDRCEIRSGERKGDFAGIGKRTYSVRLFAPNAPKTVTVDGNPTAFDYDGRYASFEMGSAAEASVILG